mgnify:CR=1 FL=1
MSLTKLIVVGALAVAILPSDKAGQQKLLVSAGAAANWAWTYCDRNEQTCETAHKGWVLFKQKAAFGAGLAQDAIWQAISAPPASQETREFEVRYTLTDADRQTKWRGHN